jgi:hypothetical protein
MNGLRVFPGMSRADTENDERHVPPPRHRHRHGRRVLWGWVRSATPLGVAVLALYGCSSTHASKPATVGTTVSATSSTTAPATSSSVASTTTATGARPPSTAPASDAESVAARLVRSLAFTPTDTSDYTYPDPNGLHVIIGDATVSNGGFAYRAFFFVHGRFIGTDVTSNSATIHIVWRGAAIIALGYAIYKTDDPMCCPLGGAVTVRYQWTGTKLVALDPIPSRDARR